jgi:hypothetical protein
MGWETINVNDIDLTAGPKPVDAGTYTLQISGAQDNKFRAGQTDVVLKITDDGPNKGRTIFLELPDPDKFPWSAELYARVVAALGVEVAPFATPKEELNRIAQNGHSRFMAEVFVEKYPKKGETQENMTGQRNKVAARSIRPAA